MSTNKMNKNIKSLNLREKDPFLKREKQRYEHPLPSREWIIELLEQKGVPSKIEVLARELSITEEEYEFFERRLKAMARDGQVLINRRGAVCAADKLDLVKCRVEAHKDGFGSYRSRPPKTAILSYMNAKCAASCTATS